MEYGLDLGLGENFDPEDPTTEWYRKTTRPPLKAKIVSREEWRAAPARGWKRLNLPIRKVSWTVDTDTPPCTTAEDCAATVRRIQERNMVKENMPDIAYSFLVGGDGNIYEGRGWFVRPHKFQVDPDCLDRTIDIAFIGRYGFPDTQYPWALHETACELLMEGQDRGVLIHNPLLLYPEEANN